MRLKKNNLLLLVVTFLFLSSCGGVKPVGGSGKIGKYIETFYKKDGMLFFVKPIAFYDGKNKTLADYTYIKNDSLKKPVIANLSVYGTPPFQLPDSVVFSYADIRILSKKVKLLYNELSKRKKFSRISTELPYDNFGSFLQAEDATILLYYGDEQKQYKGSKTWRKTHIKIHQMIFWQ